MRMEHVIFGQNIVPKRTVHSVLAGTHSSKLRGRGLDFEEVRLYVPGDDIRTIDWKVTARVGKTHTKVFNEERERPAFTVLDQTSMMFFGSEKYVKSVIAAQVAALSGYRILKKGDRFGGIVFNDQELEVIKPRRNRKSILQYLKIAESFNQQLVDRKSIKSNRHRLQEVLNRTAKSVTHDYVITIISDFRLADKEAYQIIQSMAKHNDVIFVHISDPLDELDYEASGLLSDGDYQLPVKKGDQRTRQQWVQSTEAFKQQLDHMLTRYGIPYIELDTLSSAELQIKDILSRNLKK